MLIFISNMARTKSASKKKAIKGKPSSGPGPLPVFRGKVPEITDREYPACYSIYDAQVISKTQEMVRFIIHIFFLISRSNSLLRPWIGPTILSTI